MHYTFSKIHSKYFGIKRTQKLVIHIFPQLLEVGRCTLEKDVQAQDQDEEV